MPLRNSDRSSLGFEAFMIVPGMSDYTKIPNVGDVTIDAPASPVESYKYLDGTSSQYSGTSDPETVTLNISFNPRTEEYIAMETAETSSGELQFRLQTGDESVLLPAQTGTSANKATIDADGNVTFAGVKPNLGRSKIKPGKYGEGDCVKIAGKYYRILRTTGTPPNEVLVVKDDPFTGAVGDDNVDTPITVGAFYAIVKPQLRVEFGATVTTIGSTAASPSSPVSTGQIVLAATTQIKGGWVLVPTS